jgi:DNA-binding response OmpR family regulator
MVALLVVLTFIVALVIDSLVRRGKRVPQAEVSLATATPALVPASATRPAPNVLVVDDERTVCNSCKKILSGEGYNVDVALSGEEALGKVKDSGFDLVITDWKMPKIDGLEVARRIKKEKPTTAVIIITGYPSVESSIEAIRSGIADYVPKPFSPEELTDAALRVLQKAGRVPAAAPSSAQ